MKIGELFVEIGARLDKFNKGMSDVQKSMQNIGRKLSAVGKQLTMKVTLPIVALGALSVKAFADFDKAMTESTAIMGKLSKSVKKDMADLAKTISTQTTFSAKELAAAYYYLASAGMNAEQSMKALGEVAKFAQAGAFDLSTATDLLTDAQTALGLSSKDAAKNQKNLIRVSDTLVGANTLANASVQQFSEALTQKAGMALRNLGKDMEEGVAALTIFADAGIKGSQAGEWLYMALRDLQSASLKNKKAFKEMGVAVYDAQGEMRNISDIIADLEKLMEGMSDEQRKATLATLGFQDRSQAAILTLVGFSDAIKTNEAKLRSLGGVTKEVADKQLESLSNKMTVLKNRLNLVAIELGEKLVPIVEKIAVKIEKAAKWFSNLSDGTKETIIKVALLTAALGPVLMIFGQLLIVVPKFGKALTFLAANPIVAILAGLALLALAAKKAAKTFKESMESYRKEAELTGKKISWLARVADSSRKALQMPAMDFKANMRATRGFKEELRKAQGVMSIATGVTKVLSKGVGFLGSKYKDLLGKLPKTQKQFALMYTGFKNLSTETYKNLNPALKELYDSLGEIESGLGGVTTATSKWIKESKKVIGYFRTVPDKARNAYRIMSQSAVNFQERTLSATYQWGDSNIRVYRNMANVLEQSNVQMKDRTLSVVKEVKSAWEGVSQRIKDAWIQGLSDMLRKATTWKEGMKAIFESLDHIISDVIAKNIVDAFSKMFDKMKKKAQTCIGTSGTIAGGASDSLAGGFWAFAIFVSSKLVPRVLEDFGNLFASIISGAKYTGDVISKEMLRATEGIAGKEGRKQVNETEWLEKMLAFLDKIPAALSVLIKNLSVTAKGFLALGRIAKLSLNAMIAKGRGLLESLKILKKPLDALIKKYRDAGKEIPGFLKPITDLMDKMKLHPRVFESLDAAMTILESLSGAGVLTGDAFRTLARSAAAFAREILGVKGNLNKMIDALDITKEQAQMLLPIIAKFVSAAAVFGLPVPKWMKSIVTETLGIEWDKFVKQVADPVKATNIWLDKINTRIGRVWNILDNMLPNIQTEIRDGLEPLKGIKFGASGISETVKSPTLYMAGEKGTEDVNISPHGQSGFQPNLSIESTPVNIYLDSQKVGLGIIKHFPKFSKGGQMHIHTRASKRF